MAFPSVDSAMGPPVSALVAVAPTPSKTRQWFTRLWNSWATRSLAVGAVATVLDLAIGLTLKSGLHFETRVSAMAGVLIGATFTYFANRSFAFREQTPEMASSMLKFVAVTVLSSLLHGQVVVWLTDRLSMPFALSKVLADVAIFSVGQLLLLRYVVFPKVKPSVVVGPSALVAEKVS